jgi:hypothetical protein
MRQVLVCIAWQGRARSHCMVEVSRRLIWQVFCLEDTLLVGTEEMVFAHSFKTGTIHAS